MFHFYKFNIINLLKKMLLVFDIFRAFIHRFVTEVARVQIQATSCKAVRGQ